MKWRRRVEEREKQGKVYFIGNEKTFVQTDEHARPATPESIADHSLLKENILFEK